MGPSTGSGTTLQFDSLLMPQEIQPAADFVFRDFEQLGGGFSVALLLATVFFYVNFFVGFVVYYCVGAIRVFINQVY